MLWLRRGSENNNLYVMAMVISKWYVFFYVIHTSSIFSIIYFTCMCVTIIVLMHVIHKLILEDIFWHYKLIIYNELKTISPQPIWHLQFRMSISNLCEFKTHVCFFMAHENCNTLKKWLEQRELLVISILDIKSSLAWIMLYSRYKFSYV